MKNRLRNTLLKVLSYALLFFGIFILILGIAMIFDKEPDASDNGLPIAIMSSAFLVTGGIILYVARRSEEERELLESLVSIIKSYRRITVADIAQRCGITIPRASELLHRAISLELIEGNFDRTTDEFYTSDAASQRVEYRYCPSCGSPLDRVYLKGDTIRCHSCGTLV